MATTTAASRRPAPPTSVARNRRTGPDSCARRACLPARVWSCCASPSTSPDHQTSTGRRGGSEVRQRPARASGRRHGGGPIDARGARCAPARTGRPARPRVVGGVDLLAGPADEVPPHHDRLRTAAAEQDRAAGSRASTRSSSRPRRGSPASRDAGRPSTATALEHHEGVLKSARSGTVEVARRSRSTPTSGGVVAGGVVRASNSRPARRDAVVQAGAGSSAWCSNPAGRVPAALRERHPQLDALQRAAVVAGGLSSGRRRRRTSSG